MRDLGHITFCTNVQRTVTVRDAACARWNVPDQVRLRGTVLCQPVDPERARLRVLWQIDVKQQGVYPLAPSQTLHHLGLIVSESASSSHGTQTCFSGGNIDTILHLMREKGAIELLPCILEHRCLVETTILPMGVPISISAIANVV
jgi:hypothetical protein